MLKLHDSTQKSKDTLQPFSGETQVSMTVRHIWQSLLQSVSVE